MPGARAPPAWVTASSVTDTPGSEPSTSASRSRLTPPRRSTTGSPWVQSTMVDSTPTSHGPPSSTRSMSSPRSARTWSAVVGLTRPKRLAEGAATPAGRFAPASRERPQQGPGDRVVRHAEADRRAPAGDGVGHRRGPFEQQGQGSGPERVGQQPGRGRHLDRPLVDGGRVGQVHDQRVVGRPALHREHPPDRLVVRGIGAQPVDRLGRERDQAALGSTAAARSISASLAVPITVIPEMLPPPAGPGRM